MKLEQHCLDAEQVEQFLGERVGEREEAAIAEHIENCAACRLLLERSAAKGCAWGELQPHLADREPGELEADEAQEAIDLLVDYLAPSEDPRWIGRLANYEVAGLIGRGSTGIVVKALDPSLNRYVAIKVLSPSYSANGAARKRFEREARAVAAIAHPNVVPIYSVDEYRGLPYIVMRYVPGQSLAQRSVEQGPLETCEVVRIGMQIANGLAEAHAQGIVHRDIKPANILLEKGVDRAMVTDFGLARVADEADMTRTGTVTGTPQYMSPEQAKGESIDQRSDLFSLGSVMYAACTARAPFKATTVFGVIGRVCESTPPPIREFNPSIEPWLVDFIDRLLEKDRSARFESAAQVGRLLEGELAHMQAPTIVALPERSWLRAGARRWSVKGLGGTRALFGVAGLLAVLVGGFALSRGSDQEAGPSGPGQVAGVGLGLGGLAPLGGAVPADDDEQDELAKWTEFEFSTSASFDVVAGGTLTLDTDVGNVVMVRGTTDRVELTLLRVVAAIDQAAAETVCARHIVSFSPDTEGFVSGRDAAIEAEFRRTEGEGDTRNPLRRVEWQLSIPASYNLDVHTGGGDIQVPALKGAVRIDTDGGNIEVAALRGSLDAHTNGGIIRAEDVWGDVRVHSNGGLIEIGNVDGGLDAHTRGGSIEVGNVGAHALVVTGGGRVRLGDIQGSAEARTGGGAIDLGRVQGSVTASTRGGRISVRSAAGTIDLSTRSGAIDVNLLQQPRQDCRVHAGVGALSIGLANNLALEVSASVEEGSVSAPFFAGPSGRARAVLNGGGRGFAASVGTGSITFRYVIEQASK